MELKRDKERGGGGNMTTRKINFVLKSASNLNLDEIISVKDIDELLSLIDKYGYPIIIEKNHYLEEYEKDKEKFKREYVQSLVKKVQQWKRRKAHYEIIIYDDYME